MAIFAITSTIFVIYDCMVRKRQRRVMQRLIREDKIVADLFPAQIRARMYDDDDGSLDDGEFATDARSLASKRHVERFKDDLENPDAFKSAPADSSRVPKCDPQEKSSLTGQKSDHPSYQELEDLAHGRLAEAD